MRTTLLIFVVCALFAVQGIAAENAPIMWPVSYTVKKDMPFVYPLEEIGVKYDRAIKLMDKADGSIVVKCGEDIVAVSTTLEIINSESGRSVEGILNVHFDKQNLPKGESYQLCIPEGVIGWEEAPGGTQLVNAASTTEFSVPSSLGLTDVTPDGVPISDSKAYIAVYWGFETKAAGEPKFLLYRDDEKIAELPVDVTSWDWNLGQARPVFGEYMTFDNEVNYRLVLPAGSVSSVYRDDITNDEVVINFVGAYTEPSLPFTYTWCSLYTDHSGVLNEVSFTFDRPIEITPNAKVQLYETYPNKQLIMEVTPWINTDINCWLLMCDFGGYTRDDEWGYTIVIPEGAIISADGKNIKCARSEFSNGSSGIENIVEDEKILQPYYNLQGMKVSTPKVGGLYIHNGKKIIYK